MAGNLPELELETANAVPLLTIDAITMQVVLCSRPQFSFLTLVKRQQVI